VHGPFRDAKKRILNKVGDFLCLTIALTLFPNAWNVTFVFGKKAKEAPNFTINVFNVNLADMT
jgi:hypothetical protein